MTLRFLILDTTYAVSSYALMEDGTIIAKKHHSEAQEQAMVINTITDTLLKEQGWSYNDLSGIIICSGPGSYTGMRISYSVAKGLSYVLDIPLIAVDRLSVLGYGTTDNVLIALKARAGEYFMGLKKDTGWLVAPQHSTEEDMLIHLQHPELKYFIVDSVPDLLMDTPGFDIQPIDPNEPLSVYHLGQLGLEKYHKQAFEDIAYCEPLYLKSAYTTVAKKKSML